MLDKFDNVVILEGNLVEDVSLEESSNGREYIKGTIGHNVFQGYDEDGEMRDLKACYFNFVSFADFAVKDADRMTKGKRVEICGSLDQYVAEVECEECEATVDRRYTSIKATRVKILEVPERSERKTSSKSSKEEKNSKGKYNNNRTDGKKKPKRSKLDD